MILGPFPSGSLRTTQSISKYIVPRVSAVYVGQCRMPLQLGFPACARPVHAVAIWVERTMAPAQAVVKRCLLRDLLILATPIQRAERLRLVFIEPIRRPIA